MRSSALLALAAACLVGMTSSGSAAGWQKADNGNSVEAEEGRVILGAWLEEEAPSPSPPSPRPPSPKKQRCYVQQGDISAFSAWLNRHFTRVPSSYQMYTLKICETVASIKFHSRRPDRPRPLQGPVSPTLAETTRLRNEAWGALDIPKPTTLTAPGEVTIVQIPTYVWVSDAHRTPVSETVATALGGRELRLTATATPRRLGFLRVDMGDGNTLWCDADEVAAFDYSRDPLNQPSDCFHYYRKSSESSPDLRYKVVLTAYWNVSVRCRFNGGPCANPPPAVPTQALTAPVHRIAVAELQALARPGQAA